PVVARRGVRLGLLTGELGLVHARPEDREEHPVERLHLHLVGHQERARRTEQARARDRPRQRQRARQPRRALRRDRDAGLVQAAPEGRDHGREVELDGLEPHTRLSRPAARTTSWSSPYFRTLPSVRPITSGSSFATPSSSSALSQSIASAMPGGFCMSPSRILATAVTTCTASDSDAPLTRRRTISISRSAFG